jgi:adenine/guanine phosphoribosyltransferase-like PRPP-binding protein
VALPPDATVATTAFWQALEAPADDAALAPPWCQDVPVRLPDGRVLRLPIRPRPGTPDRAVASLIANQAGFDVVDALVDAMVAQVRPWQPEAIIGLPTLGMVFAGPIARALGHARWVPLGYSRKYWYDEALSAEVSSITSPGAAKRLYVDPNQLPLLTQGRRVVLVDDAVSTGTTLLRAWDLLERCGADVLGAAVAMRQGTAWHAALGAARAARVRGVFDTALLRRSAQGWWPEGVPPPGLAAAGSAA